MAKKLLESSDDALQSCCELLETRRDVLTALEEELKQMESSYEEIVVWFHMEDRPKGKEKRFHRRSIGNAMKIT